MARECHGAKKKLRLTEQVDRAATAIAARPLSQDYPPDRSLLASGHRLALIAGHPLAIRLLCAWYAQYAKAAEEDRGNSLKNALNGGQRLRAQIISDINYPNSDFLTAFVLGWPPAAQPPDSPVAERTDGGPKMSVVCGHIHWLARERSALAAKLAGDKRRHYETMRNKPLAR